MTASDHLKHRTGSLGGDQIPEKWREVYRQCEEFLAQAGEPSTKPVEWCIQILDDLAQKTRECEEASREVRYSHEERDQAYGEMTRSQGALFAMTEENDDLKAQVEQLGRQVAEISSELQWIADQDQYTFAECTLAEEIINRVRRCLDIASRARTK